VAENCVDLELARFLANRAPYAAEFEELLTRDEVCGHDFVHGELLIGDVGGRKQLLKDYEQMHQAPVVTHPDVVAVNRSRRFAWPRHRMPVHCVGPGVKQTGADA
jgi:hypothetical protein